MHSQTLRSFHKRLHTWYGKQGRKDLPWRNTSDPYAIYVSEIMLQQTQVKTVLDRYYYPFLKRFPTLAALARAPQDEVLRAWQGLGYYNRAINLHTSAKLCSPGLPDTIEELMSLPGIGQNTAHAVAAFAYKQPVAVMEANVRRVVSRIFALARPNENELWEKATLLLDKANPFNYNQAMMDIGSLVCTKRAPSCESCPANALCKGKAAPENYPAAKAKKTVPVRHKKIVLLRNQQGDYYAAMRRSRFLNGLYHFIEVDPDATHFPLQGKNHSLAEAGHIGHIRQQYSHFTLEAQTWLMDIRHPGGKNWYPSSRFIKLPVSAAEKKMLALAGFSPP